MAKMGKRGVGKAGKSKGAGPSRKGGKAPWASPIPRGLTGRRGGGR